MLEDFIVSLKVSTQQQKQIGAKQVDLDVSIHI